MKSQTGQKDAKEVNTEIANIISKNKELLAYRQGLTDLAVKSQVSRIYSKSRNGPNNTSPTINTKDIEKSVPELIQMYPSKKEFEEEVQRLGKKAIAKEEEREKEEQKQELEDLQEIVNLPDWLDDPNDLSQEERQQRKKEVHDVKRNADEFKQNSSVRSDGKDFETERNKLLGALASLYIDHHFNERHSRGKALNTINSGKLLISYNYLISWNINIAAESSKKHGRHRPREKKHSSDDNNSEATINSLRRPRVKSKQVPEMIDSEMEGTISTDEEDKKNTKVYQTVSFPFSKDCKCLWDSVLLIKYSHLCAHSEATPVDTFRKLRNRRCWMD